MMITFRMRINSIQVILTGDFNLNLFKLDNSSNVRRYFDLISSFGLVPMMSIATNHTHNSSLIDQMWTNMSSRATIQI